MLTQLDHDLPQMTAPPRGRDDYGELPRPPNAPLAQIVADVMRPMTEFGLEEILAQRKRSPLETAETLCNRFGVEHREVKCPGHQGATLTLSVFRRSEDNETGPGFFYIHGGGMVGGDRFSGVGTFLSELLSHGGTVMTVEYRLAPEHPAPIPVEDCYEALNWAASQASDLGFDPVRLFLGGGSAGGGLAAGAMLLARDRSQPDLVGVMLECPMLDDRNNSTAVRQFWTYPGAWAGISNQSGWESLLGTARGTERVSPYDAPARATWLGGLPPVHIGVGSTDPFRDEDVAFASGIWRDGGDCELMVVPGGPHGFEALGEGMSIAAALINTRHRWVQRQLHPDDPGPAHQMAQALRAEIEAGP